MKDFRQRVYKIVKKIPKGKVTTYGEIAEKLGNKNLARAVGTALHQNPTPILIPCHRVVNKQGILAKNFRFGGQKMQKNLLKKEGIIIKQDKVPPEFFWTN